MNLKTLIIALLIMGTVMTGSYLVINDGSSANNYNVVNTNTEFQQFDQVNNLTTDLTLRYSRIQNLSADKSTVGFVSFIPDTIVIFRDMLALPFNVAYAVVNAISNILGLPSWALVFALGVLGVLVIFAFMQAVLGREV